MTKEGCQQQVIGQGLPETGQGLPETEGRQYGASTITVQEFEKTLN